MVKVGNDITFVIMQCNERPIQSYITQYRIIQHNGNIEFAFFNFFLAPGEWNLEQNRAWIRIGHPRLRIISDLFSLSVSSEIFPGTYACCFLIGSTDRQIFQRATLFLSETEYTTCFFCLCKLVLSSVSYQDNM